MAKKPNTWVYINIPGVRHCGGTYDDYDASILPPIQIDPKFKMIFTLEDVEQYKNKINQLLMSPTACYVVVEQQTNLFYCDQQGCVTWHFDPLIGVYINENPELIVSKSISEFFTRIFIENALWYGKKNKNHFGDEIGFSISRKVLKKYKNHYRNFTKQRYLFYCWIVKNCLNIFCINQHFS